LLFIITAVAFISFSCNNLSGTKKIITFKVLLPKYLPADKVYLTGNNKTLGNWDPSAVKMDKQSDSVWTKSILFEEGDKLEFKITMGSFKSEAANADGWIFDNIKLTVKRDTTIIIKVDNWKNNLYFRKLKPVYLLGDEGGIKLINNWKYHKGDNPNWSRENINDSLWETVSSDLAIENSPAAGWDNIGWFRTHLSIDSSLWGRTIALSMNQLGASEIYYNGKLLYSFGKVGNSESEFKPITWHFWKELKLDAKQDQVFAVRYANYNWKADSDIGYNPGFDIVLLNLNSAFYTSVNDIRSNSIHQMVFTLIPLILSFLHLFLFVFFRKQKQNLYYAICLLGFAGLTFFSFERSFISYHGIILLFTRFNIQSGAIAIFFGLLTLMQINYNALPKRWRMYLGVFIAIIIAGFFNIQPKITSTLIYVFFAFTLIEGIFAIFSKRTVNNKGNWLIFSGFVVMNIFIILQLLIDFSFIDNFFGTNQIYVFGMLGLVISMSLYLSYNFAYINKDLESQLNKVKVLSEKAIEQEHIAAGLEIERRLIEAENLRKTNELNSARDLQLSLLPKQVPLLDDLDIACFMQTATEVGGDYYDFHVSEDNKITAVIGDATGHGLKAGNMVILAKGLFNTLANESDLLHIMNTFNRAIKQMNLHMLTMCMSLIRIKGNNIEYSSAGMPPLHIYRKSTGKIEQLLLKGMPLGAFYDFPYNKISTDIYKGDVILIMSDGLTELFNAQKEIYGMEKVIESFRTSADKSAEEIIKHIFNDSSLWAGDTRLADDLTIMAIRMKE
jgi:serine phosphatase RsbU (regulator of sigma subunit)